MVEDGGAPAAKNPCDPACNPAAEKDKEKGFAGAAAVAAGLNEAASVFTGNWKLPVD